LERKPERKKLLEDIDIDGGKSLNSILKKYNGRAWTGLD
jgi:hypothetical protein